LSGRSPNEAPSRRDPARATSTDRHAAEYGINGLFVGVPCKLGARGIEDVIQVRLTPDEQAALLKSADAVRQLVQVIGV
jgi:malate/lactate dehydrogenase